MLRLKPKSPKFAGGTAAKAKDFDEDEVTLVKEDAIIESKEVAATKY